MCGTLSLYEGSHERTKPHISSAGPTTTLYMSALRLCVDIAAFRRGPLKAHTDFITDRP
jgi:hypothetical protein